MEILLSARHPAYLEALAGFRQACAPLLPPTGPKQIFPDRYTERVVGEPRRVSPDLVLALGTAAAGEAAAGDGPLVYLLSSPPDAPRAGPVAGVSLEANPAAGLAALQKAFPQVRRVGLVHDPRRTADLVSRARTAATGLGLDLVVAEAADPGRALAAARSLAGRIDALWLIPDVSILTDDSLDALLLLAAERHLPALGFSPRHLNSGAALAATLDLAGAGVEACTQARRLLRGEAHGVVPAPTRIEPNPTVLERLRATPAADPNGARPGGRSP